MINMSYLVPYYLAVDFRRHNTADDDSRYIQYVLTANFNGKVILIDTEELPVDRQWEYMEMVVERLNLWLFNELERNGILVKPAKFFHSVSMVCSSFDTLTLHDDNRTMQIGIDLDDVLARQILKIGIKGL